MNNTTVLIVVAAPTAGLLFLRSNAALTFLSLCLGSVLAQLAADDTTQLARQISTSSFVTTNNVALALLLLPAILTIIVTIRSVRPRKLLGQFLPAAGVGAAALFLAMPYLPLGVRRQIEHTTVWTQLNNFEVIIIGLSALICLLVVWSARPHKSADVDEGKHGRKH